MKMKFFALVLLALISDEDPHGFYRNLMKLRETFDKIDAGDKE